MGQAKPEGQWRLGPRQRPHSDSGSRTVVRPAQSLTPPYPFVRPAHPSALDFLAYFQREAPATTQIAGLANASDGKPPGSGERVGS